MIDNSNDFSVINVLPNKKKKANEKCRVLFVSDLHIGASFGTWTNETAYTFYRGGDFKFSKNHVVTLRGERIMLREDTVLHINDGDEIIFHNGITYWERGLMFIDRLFYEWDTTHFDCVILLGDIISNESNKDWYAGNREYFGDMEHHYWTRFKREYMSRLDAEGIPWYLVYANHDDMTDEQFESFFPYTKNFLINIGDESFVCADCFRNPDQTPDSRKWGYGGASDANKEFLNFCDKRIKNSEAVIFCSHFINDEKENVLKFIGDNENVLFALQGHTHEILTRSLIKTDKREVNAYDIGHFSWGADTWGLVSEETVEQRLKNHDKTPSCNNFYYVVAEETEDGTDVLQYPVFAEYNYGIVFGYGGRYTSEMMFDSFNQPRYDASITMKADATRRIKIKKRIEK